jgi:hypothetical protein
VQSNSTGSQVFVAFATAPGGPLALWNAASPGQFSTFTANDAATDIGTAADGTMFALQANGTTEIRAADLSLAAVPANPELLQIPGRVQVLDSLSIPAALSSTSRFLPALLETLASRVVWTFSMRIPAPFASASYSPNSS